MAKKPKAETAESASAADAAAENPDLVKGAAPVADAPLSKAQKAALIKGHEQEIARLSAPEPIEYPRVVYKGRRSGFESRTVANAAQHEALGEGWADSPADLEE